MTNPEETPDDPQLLNRTADIVAAFFTRNAVAAGDLARLVSETHRALSMLRHPLAPVAEPLVPAVSARKSITPDHLISLEDGKKYRTLKRHLSRMGLSPERYREKWGLPADYPMVAPSYSAQRSELAKSSGLGRKQTPEPEPLPELQKARRGRPRKAA
jgi:predicted transcriptional regulator